MKKECEWNVFSSSSWREITRLVLLKDRGISNRPKHGRDVEGVEFTNWKQQGVALTTFNLTSLKHGEGSARISLNDLWYISFNCVFDAVLAMFKANRQQEQLSPDLNVCYVTTSPLWIRWFFMEFPSMFPDTVLPNAHKNREMETQPMSGLSVPQDKYLKPTFNWRKGRYLHQIYLWLNISQQYRQTKQQDGRK